MDFEWEFEFFKIEDEMKRFEIVRMWLYTPLIVFTQFSRLNGWNGWYMVVCKEMCSFGAKIEGMEVMEELKDLKWGVLR